MSPLNTCFIFVPGGFSPAYYFYKVVNILVSQGYTARAIDLPSMDASLREKGETPGMYEDAALMRGIVSEALDQGHNVVLVGSSYGGAVAMEACKGITVPDRKVQGSTGELKHLVLLGSFLAEAGFSIKDLAGDNIPINISEGALNAVTYLEPVPPAIAGAVQCGSLPKEEQERLGAMGKAISVTTEISLMITTYTAFLDPLTFAAWKEIPTTLVIGGNDVALSPEIQHEHFDKAAEKGAKGLRKVVIQGGDHLTMLGHPEEVVKVCLEAAGVSN